MSLSCLLLPRLQRDILPHVPLRERFILNPRLKTKAMSWDFLVEMLVVLVAVAASPIVSRLTRLPVMVVEVLLGLALGPSLLNVIGDGPVISLLATIGFIYLMFLAGLEVEVALIRRRARAVALMSASSFAVPMALGYMLALRYGLPAEFMAVALSTTSVGVVLPLVRELGPESELGQVLLGSSVLVDVMSMFALAYVVEERLLGLDRLLALLAAVAASAWLLAYVRERRGLSRRISEAVKSHHLDVRLSLAVIFVFALMAEVVGVHAILGSFFAGLVMSGLEGEAEDLLEKLRSFGYGFFTPIFFVSVGAKTDLAPLLSSAAGLELLAALVTVAVAGKVVGALASSALVGLSLAEGLSVGLAMSARLSLVLAAAELGLAVGLIGHDVFSALVLLALVTTLLSPSLAKLVLSRALGRRASPA